MKIVVDAMGGDFAPSEVVKGAFEAVKNDPNIELILIGDENQIKDNLPQSSNLPITIHHTEQTVEMTDKPSNVIKLKPNSSLVAGIKMIKKGKARAFVSAGSTGAILATSLFLLGRIEGVKRPAIGVFLPSGQNGIVLCDAGASLDAKPVHLMQFAIMASEYMSHIRGIENPKVGLLNVGVEETKGNDLYLEAHSLMKKYLPAFIGNVESRYIFEDQVDVIVCDGFLGNNLVKFAEGWIGHVNLDVSKQIEERVESHEKKNEFRSIFSSVMQQFEYEEYGGVPLLGVNGNVIICHGSSPARAIKNAVFAAKKSADTDLIGSIRDDISSTVSLIGRKA